MMSQAEQSLVQLVYASTASIILSENELKVLLRSSRKSNEEHGITGMLLHQNGNYMQAIEGSASQVDSLFKVLQQDKRHFDIVCLYRENRLKREFSDWSMAFRNLDNESIEGYSGFLRPTNFVKELETGRTKAKKLFRRFREITRR